MNPDTTNSNSRDQFQQAAIAVEVRLNQRSESKLKAYADVTISGLEGSIAIEGFAVFQSNGDAPSVGPPARKGDKKYFPVVTLNGGIRRRVESAILAEYNNQIKS